MKFNWKVFCIFGIIFCFLLAAMHIAMGQPVSAGFQLLFAAGYTAGLSFILIKEVRKKKKK